MLKLDNLPKELTITILLNLSAEDLLVCKCVCKSLYSLITNPSFIDEHRKARKNSYILVEYEDSISENHVIALLSHETLEVVDTKRVLSDTQLVDSEWSRKSVILACCNGVLCLYYYRQRDAIVRWNPATRDAKLVPNGLYQTKPDKQLLYRIATGFGFDAKNNDLKLVSIQQLFRYELFGNRLRYSNEPYKQEVEVYSLKTGSWRLLRGNVRTFDLIISSCFGVHSAGMCSWLVWDAKYGKHVISFDMSDEVFISTLLPPCLSESNRSYHIELFLHNGYLAIANHNFDEYNIWVLGKYGVKESWTNPFLIAVGPLVQKPLYKTTAVGFWKNTEVLMQDRGADHRVSQLILVDPTIKTRRDVDIRGTKKLMQVFNYQESRVRIH